MHFFQVTGILHKCLYPNPFAIAITEYLRAWFWWQRQKHGTNICLASTEAKLLGLLLCAMAW
jgi:hypothetical protein